MFRDGPLTRRAPETIRYGTGRCALGALLVASSGQGIVSIMVRDTLARADPRPRRAISQGEPRSRRKRQQSHGRESRPVHRGAVPAFRAAAGYPRHRSAAARVERGAQDPLRRDLHLLEDRRGDRRAEGDPRGRRLVLTELVCLRRPVSPRAAQGRRDGAEPPRRPTVRLGRLRGEARREAAKVDQRSTALFSAAAISAAASSCSRNRSAIARAAAFFTAAT